MRGALARAARAGAATVTVLARERGRRQGEVGRGAEVVPGAHPVLLLHGFLSTCRTVRALERRLRRNGYAASSLELPSTRRGIDELALLLRREVERLHARAPGMGRLTIVAHSQGGLVAAQYVKKLGGARRVRAVVTLGTPHRGTPLALAGLPFRWLARSLAQMTPGSAFLRELEEGEWPESVSFTSLYSREDWVVPHPSALLDTSRGRHLRNVRVEGSHFDFLRARSVHAVLLRELRELEQQAPAPRPSLVAVPPLARVAA